MTIPFWLKRPVAAEVYDIYFHASDAEFEAHAAAARVERGEQARRLRPDAHAHTIRDAVELAVYQMQPATILDHGLLVATWSAEEGARYYAGRAP